MKKFFYIITLLLGAQALYAQERGFVINGKVNLPDGYSVGIVCQTDTAYSVDIAHGYVKKGKFTHGQPGTGHPHDQQPGTD